MHGRVRETLLVLAALLTVSPVALAEEQRPSSHRLTAIAGVFGELGPLKGSYSVGLRHRWTYGRDDENPLWDNLYVESQLEVYPNPFIPSFRLQVEWTPIAPIRLTAAYTNYWYADWENDLGHGLSMASKDSPFDADTLAARKGEQETQHIQRVELKPVFQFKLDRLIIYNELELGVWIVDGPEGYWYDPLYDGLVRRGGTDLVLMNRTAVVVEAWKGIGDETVLMGVVNQVVKGFGADTLRNRLGAVVILQPFDALWVVDRPLLAVQVGMTTTHASRRFELYAELVLYLYFDLWRS